MDWTLQREPTQPDYMFGNLTAGDYSCYTLEDELRKVKVDRETAIPAGRYEVVMENSQRFGPDTLTLVDVPGFTHIRIHGGNTEAQTEGCILVGNRRHGRDIFGSKQSGVLDKLKEIFRGARGRDERVWLTIKNASGDRYVDSGELASA